jgi:hypothetical protein
MSRLISNLSGVTYVLNSDTSGRARSLSWCPSSRRLGCSGPGATQRTARVLTVFSNMSAREIETAIRQAYRYSTRVGGHGDVIILRGKADGMTIEMVYDRVTQTITSAYPVP